MFIYEDQHLFLYPINPHHTRLREKDDLPLWRGPAVKNLRALRIYNACVLITSEIMHSRDTQSNTEE